jgi:hypothetical protein
MLNDLEAVQKVLREHREQICDRFRVTGLLILGRMRVRIKQY